MKIHRRFPNLFAALVWALITTYSHAQSLPEIKTFKPDGFPIGWSAPRVDLCTPQAPCGAIATIAFDLRYDTIFDLAKYKVDGFWLSYDHKATVRIDNYSVEKRLHIAISRDSAVAGGGILMTLDGVGITDLIPAKQDVQGLQTDENPLSIGVYPNPCTSECNFSLTTMAQRVMLVDIQGNTIWQATELAPGIHSIPIETANPGIYLLRTESKETTSTTKICVTKQ